MLGFRSLAFLIARVPLGLAEKILLIAGGGITMIGFIVLIVLTAPLSGAAKSPSLAGVSRSSSTSGDGRRQDPPSVSGDLVDKKSRECIWGIILGMTMLLSSFPILHIWSCNTDTNISGPVGVNLILSITGFSVVVIYMIRLPSLRDQVINNHTYWIIFQSLLGLGIFVGSFFGIFGAWSFVRFGDYRIGLTLLVCSVVFCLGSVIVALVAYAKQRPHIWELETIIEKRTDILQRRKRSSRPIVALDRGGCIHPKETPAIVRVVDFV